MIPFSKPGQEWGKIGRASLLHSWHWVLLFFVSMIINVKPLMLSLLLLWRFLRSLASSCLFLCSEVPLQPSCGQKVCRRQKYMYDQYWDKLTSKHLNSVSNFSCVVSSNYTLILTTEYNAGTYSEFLWHFHFFSFFLLFHFGLLFFRIFLCGSFWRKVLIIYLPTYSLVYMTGPR